MLLPYVVFLAAAARGVHSQACPAPVRTEPVAANAPTNTGTKVEREPDTVLSPLPNPDVDPANLQNVVPVKDVALDWGGQGNGLVHVSLEMNHPTVLLEQIGAIAAVDCEAASVTVVFSRADAFDEAVAGWSVDGGVVLVTNHLGDCDEDNERGVFLAQGITSDSDTLTVVALGEKTDINSTAGFTEISFSSIPAHSKRAVKMDKNGLTLSHSVSLPPATSLYSYRRENPYVDVQVTADNADLNMGVTFSGKLRYSLLRAKLYELSFDVDAHASVALGLTANLTAEFNTTFAYEPEPLTYSIVRVPGIVSLSPGLDFAIGVDLTADGAASVTTDLGAEIANGNFHLDLLDRTRSSATNWKPTFHAEASIRKHAAVTIDPYVDVTARLDFQLLGGLVDLSGGMTARPRFNNDFTLRGDHQLNATWHRRDEGEPRAVSRAQGEYAGCTKGLGIKSDFEFTLVAFVTQWWEKTIYSVAAPIADKCYFRG